jgi:hypothetical protein
MAKPKEPSSLVAAAAALDDELSALTDLAGDARRETLDTERSMTRATRSLTDSVQLQARIEEKLRALVHEIESARVRQQEAVGALVDAAHELERRAKSRDVLLERFTSLGVSAGQINELALELNARRTGGAQDSEVLDRLSDIQRRMASVVDEAEGLIQAAKAERWPEIARQADGLKQQMQSAKNKLAIAHRDVASRAPS